MSNYILYLIVLSSLGQVQPKIFDVQDQYEFYQAINRVEPGDVINLVRDSGLPKIEFKGFFNIERSGNTSHPIHFNGHPNITINQGKGSTAIVLNANYWILNGHFISAGGGATGGLSIFGDYNKISNSEFKHGSCLYIRGRFNQLSNTQFSNCSSGIRIWDGSNNLVENCELIYSKNFIEIIRGNGNILVNNSATINDEYSYNINGRVGTNRSVSPFVIDGLNGVFEGNRIIDNRLAEDGVNLSTFSIDSANYTIANNSIMTKYSNPFKIGTLNYSLPWSSIGVIFDGNTMEFTEKREPSPYCIIGNSDFYYDKTEIRKNNICTNGKLTNIYEIKY